MTTEELIKDLQKRIGMTIALNLQGIISTKLEIEKMQMRHENGSLCFQDENNTHKIELNLHQLMKICKIKENEYLLEFDQLQTITITIK